MRRLLPLLPVAALCACMSIGRPFPTERVKDIQVGRTTRDQIRAAYGEPYRTGVEDGDATWTYLRYKLSAFSGEKTTDLFIRFNADGTVKSYAFNTNEDPAR